MIAPQGSLSESVEKVVQLLRDNAHAKRDGAKAEAVIDMARQAKAILSAFAQAPVTGQMLAELLAMSKDFAQTRLEEKRLDPCEASAAARHMLRVYVAYQTASNTLRAFARDKRFHWLSSPLQRLEDRVPRPEINAQMIALEGIFGTALQATELAATKVYRVRDPLVHLGANPGQAPVPFVPAAECLITLPRDPFTTAGQRVRRMRYLMFRFADQLEHEAESGKKTLMRSALDAELTAVRPEAVSGAVRSATYTIACCLLTCAALLNLLHEPTMIESAEEGDDTWAK
jgi:hypothetical protein